MYSATRYPSIKYKSCTFVLIWAKGSPLKDMYVYLEENYRLRRQNYFHFCLDSHVESKKLLSTSVCIEFLLVNAL